MTVDRVWTDYDSGNALVSYKNDSGREFSAVVTVQCDAFDAAKNKLGTNQRSFFVHEVGTIAPGFTGTLKIPVQLHGATLATMECWISRAR